MRNSAEYLVWEAREKKEARFMKELRTKRIAVKLD
jgi:hypothetical protein